MSHMLTLDEGENGEDVSGQVAVIGMAGRFPKSKNIEQFWKNITGGVECVSFFSSLELADAGVDPKMAALPNFVNARAIIDDPALFDARFFQMSPKEAQITDPQHRLFLECAHEALEDAGCDPARYEGYIGVYAGADINSYALANLAFSPNNASALIGNDKDYLATRVSFKLNLRGPGITIQTACSTSLVAVHMACQGLMDYQCDIAMAGGVGVNFPQKCGYIHQEGMVLSPDGHCRAFDMDAKGTPGGDGVGVVVLKRLEDARADGAHIYAIIKGSAINNDSGLKVGFTAPSIDGQAEVIAMAQEAAGVQPCDIGYVEAHGTGTELGDPIELTALTEAFRAGTDKRGYCAIGSLKTNVGHMNSASGIGGLIKTVLAVQKGKIPPSLNFEKPNPKLNIDQSPFFVNTSLKDWESNGKLRLAGVSSFGAGGTNVHAIVQEAPRPEPSLNTRSRQLLILSAKTPSALETASANFLSYLQTNPENLADIAYTLQTGRQLFEHKRILVCSDIKDAVSGLETRGKTLTSSQCTGHTTVAFMFPGQGTQSTNMGKEIYDSEIVFREEFDRCAQILAPLLDCDLRQIVYPENENETNQVILNQTQMAQPAIFAVEYALARLWISWGVHPEAMIGHSVGELVAACLSGVFSLEDALYLVAVRSKLMQKLPAGQMIAARLTEAGAKAYENVSIAAVNAPERCVLSGDPNAISEVTHLLTKDSIPWTKLHTSHAFHSHMVTPVVDEFREAFKKVTPHEPQIPFVSNCTGTWITAQEAMSSDYWAKHIRQTVRFGTGLATLMDDPGRILLEVGPGTTLSSLVKTNTPPGKAALGFNSLGHPNGKKQDMDLLLEALGQLYGSNVKIDWKAFYKGETRSKIPLPTYPFERELFWSDPGKQFQGKSDMAPTCGKKEDTHGKKNAVSDWLYLPSWKRSQPNIVSKGKDIHTRRCLLLTHGAGPIYRIIQELEKQVGEVIVLEPGKAFYKLSEFRYSIDPANKKSYEQLFKELLEVDRMPHQIIHSLDMDGSIFQSPEKNGSDKICKSEQFLGTHSLIAIAGALGTFTLSHPIQLDVLTHQTSDVTGEELLDPERSMIIGPCRIIPQENERINCRTIDIAIPGTEKAWEILARSIVDELTGEAAETMVAYRGKHRWVEIFEPVLVKPTLAEAVTAEPIPGDEIQKVHGQLRLGGVYLITGGLGNIGLTLAQFLADSVSANLVLTGRSGLPPREEWDRWQKSHDVQNKTSQRINKVRKIESCGSQVLILSADVSDKERMQEIFHSTKKQMGPINGVIHAAGIVGQDAFCTINDMDREHSQRHFYPKVQGVYTLEKLIPRDLDFCILISSLSTVIGGVGLAAYAAANQFMDAFAHDRNQTNGTHWVSINWDRWHLDGPDVDAALNMISKQTAIGPDEGNLAFKKILDLLPIPQVVVSVRDLEKSIDEWVNLDPMRSAAHPPGRSESRHSRPDLDTQYLAPNNETEKILAEIWSELFSIEPIGVHDNFFQLGGDSLMAIQLVARVQEHFLIKIGVNNLFDEPTIADLAQKIITYQEENKDLIKGFSEKLEMIESLSDEQVKQMLDQMAQKGETI